MFLYGCLCNQRNVQSPASRVQSPASSAQGLASRVQRPESRVQRSESSVQCPASRVQRPASNSWVQSPGIPVCTNSTHREIIKTSDFKGITKEYLQDRINTLIINEKISNKTNRNLDSYSVSDDTKEIRDFRYSSPWQIF